MRGEFRVGILWTWGAAARRPYAERPKTQARVAVALGSRQDAWVYFLSRTLRDRSGYFAGELG
jgi:hypothetical protein